MGKMSRSSIRRTRIKTQSNKAGTQTHFLHSEGAQKISNRTEWQQQYVDLQWKGEVGRTVRSVLPASFSSNYLCHLRYNI